MPVLSYPEDLRDYPRDIIDDVEAGLYLWKRINERSDVAVTIMKTIQKLRLIQKLRVPRRAHPFLSKLEQKHYFEVAATRGIPVWYVRTNGRFYSYELFVSTWEDVLFPYLRHGGNRRYKRAFKFGHSAVRGMEERLSKHGYKKKSVW